MAIALILHRSCQTDTHRIKQRRWWLVSVPLRALASSDRPFSFVATVSYLNSPSLMRLKKNILSLQVSRRVLSVGLAAAPSVTPKMLPSTWVKGCISGPGGLQDVSFPPTTAGGRGLRLERGFEPNASSQTCACVSLLFDPCVSVMHRPPPSEACFPLCLSSV